MKKLLSGALAALLLLSCVGSTLAADVKPLVNDAGKIRPVHSGETVPVANGGTGATTQSAARSGLGLGTFATQDYATPPAIGGTTPAAGAFTTLGATGNLTTNVTGSTQCLQVNSSGVISGAGSACGTSSASPITFKDEGSTLTTATTSVDCVGSTITCTNVSGAVTMTLTGGGGGTSTIVGPQGRLSLTSGVAVMTADVTAASSVYYVPFKGKYVPIYDGAAWDMKSVGSGLTMALDTSNQLSLNLYDLFIFNDSGTIKIGAGPAWTNTATVTISNASPGVISWTAHGLSEGAPVVFSTSGGLPTGLTAGTTYYVSKTSLVANSFVVSTSVANAAAGTNVNTSSAGSGTHTAVNGTGIRGTGAGTTELELKDGVWTNKVSITLTNGAGAGVSGVAANKATYVGTVYMTANGQTGMALLPAAASGGTNNVLGVFNAYNRVPVAALCRDTVASYTYNSTTFRASNGSVSNRVAYVDGLAQLRARAVFQQLIGGTGAGAGTAVMLNATTGTPNYVNRTSVVTQVSAADTFAPVLGLSYVQAVEASQVNTTFYGSNSSQQVHALRVDLEM